MKHNLNSEVKSDFVKNGLRRFLTVVHETSLFRRILELDGNFDILAFTKRFLTLS